MLGDIDARFQAQIELTPELLDDPEVYARTELDGPEMADERAELARLAERASTGDEQARADFSDAMDRYPGFFSQVIARVDERLQSEGTEG